MNFIGSSSMPVACDVAVVVPTTEGDRLFPFGKRFDTIEAAEEVAAI